MALSHIKNWRVWEKVHGGAREGPASSKWGSAAAGELHGSPYADLFSLLRMGLLQLAIRALRKGLRRGVGPSRFEGVVIMEVTRSYNHKAFGAIGQATFTAPDGEFKLNGNVLPDSSVAHLLMFALQSLQDSYAGAKAAADAVASYETKLGKIIAGTLGTRSGGEGASEEQRVARSVTRAAMKDALGKDSPEYKAFEGLSDADQLAKLDENYAANEKALKPLVDARLAAKAAERAAKAKAAEKVTFKL